MKAMLRKMWFICRFIWASVYFVALFILAVYTISLVFV